jgi:hypothetical protein
MKKVALWALIFLAIVPAKIAKAVEDGKSANTEPIYLQLMPMLQWNDLSDSQQELYVKGFLETLSFMAYGSAPRDQKDAQRFSDWTACAEHEPAKSWTGMYDWQFGKLQASGAWQCFKASSMICEKYTGKGDGRWKPIQLVSTSEWKRFTPQDKEVYAIAYAETADLMSRLTKQDTNANKLENCVKHGGDQRFFSAAKEISVETQYPMPWSVSRALGNTCH